MINKHIQESDRPYCTLYQLTLQGKLPKDFKDWFNGMLIATELNAKCNSITTLTCKVRDQAELIGIINWMHNMNLIIEKVCLFHTGSEREDAKKNELA